MKYRYSLLNQYDICPRQFYFRYVKNIDGESKTKKVRFNDPLLVGSCLHLGIEKGLEECLNLYKSKFNNDEWNFKHDLEVEKFKYYVPVLHDVFKDGIHELTLDTEINGHEFGGTLDYLTEDYKTLYDFKYTKSGFFYQNSYQLNCYNLLLEDNNYPTPEESYYLFIPKCTLSQRYYEDDDSYYKRCISWVLSHDVYTHKSKYNRDATINLINSKIETIEADDKFQGKITGGCEYCDYKIMCDDYHQYLKFSEVSNKHAVKNPKSKKK